MLPITEYHPPLTLIQEIQDISNHAKATQFYLHQLCRKSITALSQSYLTSLAIKERAFGMLAQQVHQAKIKQLHKIRASSVFSALRNSLDRSRIKRRRNLEIISKIQRSKLRCYFERWSYMTILNDKAIFLKAKRKKEHENQFMMLLREYKINKEMINLQLGSEMYQSRGIYSQNLLRKAFKAIKFHQKSKILSRFLQRERLTEILAQMKRFNRQSWIVSLKFQETTAKSNFFFAWKELYQTKIADNYQKNSLISKSFLTWKDSLQSMIKQRQIDEANEQIVAIFRDQKAQVLLKRIMVQWSNYAAQSKDQKKQNQILNKYATLMYREKLLSRAFNGLREGAVMSHVDRDYYKPCIRRRVLHGLRSMVERRQAMQAQAIDKMKFQRLRVCFKGILSFNRQQREKVARYRLKRAWDWLTFELASRYYITQNKAEQFARTNLLFKCFYGLNLEVAFSNNLKFLVSQLNVRRPLKRWRTRHNAHKRVRQKQWLMKKAIVREWKLQVIKLVSAKKVARQSSTKSIPMTQQKGLKTNQNEESGMQFSAIMETVAKIRRDLMSEQQDSNPSEPLRWPVLHTPEHSFNFSSSLEN